MIRVPHLLFVALSVTFALCIGKTSPPPLAAQVAEKPARLAGVVVSTSGAPIRNAIVNIAATGRESKTNALGRFAFPGMHAGLYEVRVRRLGYREHVTSLVLPVDEEVRFVLVPLALRLPAIDVIRDRTRIARHQLDAPGSVHLLERSEVVTSTKLFDDVHRMLRQVPGVNIQEEDGFGLRPNIGLRGTGSERSSKITLMEDGVLIAPAPYAAPAAYYFPVAGRMDAVEVRKGSSQLKYGPRTIGGAVNLVSTPIPEDFSIRGEVAGGEHATRKILGHIGDSYTNAGWSFETYQIESDGFKQVDAPSAAGFDVENYVTKLRLNSNADAPVYQEVELKFAWYDETSNETYLGLTDADFSLTPNRRYAASQLDVMKAQHRQFQIRHFLQPNDRVDLTTTAYRNDFQRNWYKLQSVADRGLNSVLANPSASLEELTILRGGDSEPDALRVRANNRDYFGEGLQSVLGVRLGGDRMQHQIEVGGRWHRDQEDRFQHEDAFQMVGGVMVLTTAGQPGSQSNRVSDANALSFFVQDEIAVGNFMVTPGIRYETVELIRTDFATDDPNRLTPERVRSNRVSALIPGVGVNWRVHDDARVFGGVHRGFAPPGPGADEATQPERSISYELGLRVDRQAFSVEVAGFFNDYSNILGAATLATGEIGNGDQFNGGAVHVAGLEGMLRVNAVSWNRGSVRLPLSASFTYTNATFRHAFESDYDPWGSVAQGDYLPYVPTLQWHASLGLATHRWMIQAATSFVGRMRTAAGQGDIDPTHSTDPAFVAALSARFELSERGSLFVGIQNAFDRRYVVARRPSGIRPGLPRTILGGMKLRM